MVDCDSQAGGYERESCQKDVQCELSVCRASWSDGVAHRSIVHCNFVGSMGPAWWCYVELVKRQTVWWNPIEYIVTIDVTIGSGFVRGPIRVHSPDIQNH